ncbi:PXA domain-containing protein [Apiosordaria backusii]|uniref:PXA domain-containing protein n=1 Tax=Apiosordaria backusii TaxID=314023 RepID=A0AA40ENA1_9PEZI|nr:PXA domain-containing protein [Apiosordaria backusii]
MALQGRDIALAGIASFIAWGYAVNWFPALRWAGYAFVSGVLLALAALLALTLLTSRGGGAATRYRKLRNNIITSRPNGALFVGPEAWRREVAALRQRQTYSKLSLCPESPKVSAALDEVLGYVIRDFIRVWYASISKNPVFENEVDGAIRGALLRVRDRFRAVDLAEVLTTRLVPILTAHFRDFAEAEKSVRGRKLNRSVTETEELDLAIASKYKEGKLHPAASLAFSDTKTAQQDYLRGLMARVLPMVLSGKKLLGSRAVGIVVREMTACAVLFPVMQMLADPDTWNQLMENYGRSMLQDRSTVRKLRAALDQHASPAPKAGKPVAFPRLLPSDSERRFEKFIRAIRKLSNLSDARRFRSEVASQLKRDSQQENVDQVYMRRLEMGKRLLDQKVHHLATPGDRRALPQGSNPALATVPSVSKLENASLTDLLRDPSGLSYFMEYMDRQRLMPLVQFWLVVDGFRNPLEDDGLEGEQLPLQLPPWTESDRLDLAQIDAAYLSRPELKVPDSSKRIISDFLKAGRRATPEQYYRARREILRAQSAVLEEMRVKHFQNFRKSEIFYKALAAEEASRRTTASVPVSTPALPRAASYTASSSKPHPVSRLAPRLQTNNNNPQNNRRAGSATDLRAMSMSSNGGNDPGPLMTSVPDLRDFHRSGSVDEGRGPSYSPNPLFDDEVGGTGDNDPMADSIASIDQDNGSGNNMPDTKVVQAMERALNNILEDSQQTPLKVEELRNGLFGDEDPDTGSMDGGLFGTSSATIAAGKQRAPSDDRSTTHRGSLDLPTRSSRGSLDTTQNPKTEKPSLASLGLVSAASRIGVFVDDDLFGDENRFLSDEPSDIDEAKDSEDDIAAVHLAAPGDLGLAEAITTLTNEIDKLVTQEAVVDSLLRKAELTNNTAELRILRKSKASLQRELRRKELQRRQYVIQESDNSLYGRSTVRILKDIEVGRDEEGKEFAVYAVEVSRNAGEKMPAAKWIVKRRYSEFLELHQKLRGQYPSVRGLEFPRRRMVMKLEQGFLQKRRAGLERYLGELLLLPEVCRSRDLRAFLSQNTIGEGGSGGENGGRKDMISRLYDSVADGMEDILGSIPVLDQLSLAGQNLIAAATSQLSQLPLADEASVSGTGVVLNAAEAEAELNAFENGSGTTGGGRELEPFVKPICDVFLEVFELNRGNNWLRGRAVVVVLHQLLGGTIERKLRDNVKMLVGEEQVLRYVQMVKMAMWPGPAGEMARDKKARTGQERQKTRTEASLMLATLVPDLAGSVVGRLNAQAASRRIFATLNNSRLNAHLAFTFLDEIIDILFES